jgi:signal transduction histidine kinase
MTGRGDPLFADRPDEPLDRARLVGRGPLVPGADTPLAKGPSPEAPIVAVFSFRTRLTIALIATAVLPLAAFGLLMLRREDASGDPGTLSRILLFAIAAAAIAGVLVALLLAADLTRPLRAIAAAVDRVSAGDLSTRLRVAGEDEVARLAESHNRLAADLERRNTELDRILAAIVSTSPAQGADEIARVAGEDACDAFGMIDAAVLLVDPREIAAQEDVPGEPRPVRAHLRIGDETIGVLIGRLPATRRWEPADQDLLELFAAEVAVAIRNAQLFARVEAQNAKLVELDAAKDDFLRGISHNLQTPLTSIRAYAEQLGGDRPDRRLAIIAEQSERLSRMVRQLLTVSRLESGALKPKSEVVALGSRVRRTWEALAVSGVSLELDDRAEGWLAIADPDQLDQVLWALLDNAAKYGAGSPVRADVAADPDTRAVRLTIADAGPGVAPEDRERLFGRFERRRADGHPEGTGLGLYVSRALCRAMGGDLDLAPPSDAPGAAFVVTLPGEPPDEA